MNVERAIVLLCLLASRGYSGIRASSLRAAACNALCPNNTPSVDTVLFELTEELSGVSPVQSEYPNARISRPPAAGSGSIDVDALLSNLGEQEAEIVSLRRTIEAWRPVVALACDVVSIWDLGHVPGGTKHELTARVRALPPEYRPAREETGR